MFLFNICVYSSSCNFSSLVHSFVNCLSELCSFDYSLLYLLFHLVEMPLVINKSCIFASVSCPAFEPPVNYIILNVLNDTDKRCGENGPKLFLDLRQSIHHILGLYHQACSGEPHAVLLLRWEHLSLICSYFNLSSTVL